MKGALASKLLVPAVLLAVFWGTLPFAGATHAPLPDPADNRGALDLSRIRMIGNDEPRWVMSTYETWSIPGLRDTGFFTIELDTFGTAHPDYYVLVRSTGTRFVGSLWRDHQNRPDERLRTLRVSRPTAASIRVRVPITQLNFGSRAVYFWRVTTLWTGPRCRRVCIDHAPNGDRMSEPVPGALPPSPTPSFTIVPTESPTPTISPASSTPASPTPAPTS